MEVFLTVVVVFGIVVGVWQPWGAGELQSSGHVYCVSSDFRETVAFYPTFATQKPDTVAIQFANSTFYRSLKPAITGIGIDYFEMVDGQSMFHFTEFGAEAMSRLISEMAGEHLSVLSGDQVVWVTPVRKDFVLDEESGVVVGTPVEFGEKLCP